MAFLNLKINKLNISEKNSPIFFPDIGTFFNQDIKLAKKLIQKLANSGAEVIKGEILHDPNIALNINVKEPYLKNNGNLKLENTRKLIERKIVTLDKYEKLFNYCKKINIPFVLSVYDFKGADFAFEIGASALKIASSNIVHRPLIEHVTRYNIPIILDTGKSSFDEISRAIKWCRNKKFNKLHIQHSPYAPPAPINKHDLRMIQSLKKYFKCTVGLSDHHHGNEMLYAAIALGATTVEKGIISSEIKDDQDVYHALNIDDFKHVNQQCKNIFYAMGKEKRDLKKNDPRHSYRMGIVANRNIKKGTKIDLSMLSFSFPKKGIPVEDSNKIYGKKIGKNIKKNNPIFWTDINGINSK